METESAEMQNRLEDVDYDLNRTRARCEKAETHLEEALQKIKVRNGLEIVS